MKFPFDFPAITVTLSGGHGVSFRIGLVGVTYIAAYLRANMELWQRLVYGNYVMLNTCYVVNQSDQGIYKAGCSY